MPPFASAAPSFVRLFVVATVAGGLGGCAADMSRLNEGPFSMASRGNTPPGEMTASIHPPQSAPVERVQSEPLSGAPQPGNLPAPPPAQRASTGATPAARVATPARSPQQNGVHTVAAKETLTSIAKVYGKTRVEIARANSIKPDATVRSGQRLSIPGIAQSKIKVAAIAPEPKAQPTSKVAATTAPAPKAAATPAPAPAASAQLKSASIKSAALEPPATATARLATPTVAAAAEAKDSQPSATGAAPTFRWPVRGRVISGFGKKPDGERNDGINLAVPEGTSIMAAEDGTVIYAGNELKSYGNLVLIRHADGWVSAYAHNSELKVAKGDRVQRGQVISLSGMSGGVTTPQVHFELRKDATPVDPLQHMSES